MNSYNQLDKIMLNWISLRENNILFCIYGNN